MEKGYKTTDANGNVINVDIMGYFSVPELEKEFVMYSLVDENPDTEMGSVILGEVVKEDDNVQILDIREDEVDLVVAFYNEISTQIGGE